MKKFVRAEWKAHCQRTKNIRNKVTCSLVSGSVVSHFPNELRAFEDRSRVSTLQIAVHKELQ